ncbi:hypothetical protein SAMN04488570_0735 [Nocardioides scoriae]|uniref:Uncharacterized protein n=1 Tax=Nocardioides scoriae TaxID=642780 RepID=A0A1H1N0K5_9ACTN|nr:hypothetical protein [Nocardioides scoriae]SDR92516.1 hypothetical protein SAMN04488570_0735 [Nocardioides scoriae]
MDSPLVLALATGLGVALVLVVALLAAVRHLRTTARGETEQARAEAAALRTRLDDLAERLERSTHRDAPAVSDAAYVITDAGRAGPPDRLDAVGLPMVADRVVLNAALGEPLVKAVALGHGVRRALSAESRNRIRFEVRRETRRARKQRRREMKQAWRDSRARAA